MIKGIIFDLGSTLIKFEGNWQTTDREGAEAMATWYLKKKHIKLDGDALRQHLAGQLADYKIPRHVFVIESLQRAPNGKPDYGFVNDYAERQMAAGV